LALNEKTIKQYIEESLKRRNQWEESKFLINLIYERILPMYEKTPYHGSNKLRQLRKMYFIEWAVQECDLLKYRVHIPDLLFAAVCTDLALVEDEFNPLYRVKEQGIESARVTREKFKDILTIYKESDNIELALKDLKIEKSKFWTAYEKQYPEDEQTNHDRATKIHKQMHGQSVN
jgi:hypothetical protein